MRLAEDEREVLLAETAQALEQITVPELRVRYGELLTAVDQGEVPEELLEPLQTLLEVGLESGRIRRLHTAHGEMAAGRVYARTPAGQAARASAEAVNQALAALEGRAVREVKVGTHGPGRYSLTLATDAGTLLLRFDRQGVRLQSVEVG
jgi:hypothetical protein